MVAASISTLRSRATALGAAVDRRAALLLGLFLTTLLAGTAVLAERAPLWNDELFTYYMCRLSTPGEVWSELATGVEQTPFSFYLATQAVVRLLGDDPLVMRLPEMVGFALASVCLFLFVARRSSPLYGFLAMLVPLASTAYDHAYEARAYALVLGFSAAALLCWQVATEGGARRRLAALGTGVSLAAAVGSHYYAVLMLIPLLAGEAGRSLRRRRIDWLVLGSFSGAVVPLLVFAPLIKAAQEYSTTFWAQPTWMSAARFHLNLLSDRRLWAVVGLVLLGSALIALRSPSPTPDRPRPIRRIPEHELLALGTLVLLPVFGVLAGKLVTGAFTGRYVIPAVLGVAALIALGSWMLDREAPVIGISLVLLFAVLVGVRFTARYDEATRDAERQARAYEFLQEHVRAGLPVVISSPHEFFELSHRSAEDGGPRFVYLADPALALMYLDTDAVDLGVLGMEDVAPLDVERYRAFLAAHPHFLVYGEDGAWDWVTAALKAKGARMRVVARNPADGAPLFETLAQ